MKKRLIAIGLAILLCLTVISGCTATDDAIPDEARLYLELTLINLETEGEGDVDAAWLWKMRSLSWATTPC